MTTVCLCVCECAYRYVVKQSVCAPRKVNVSKGLTIMQNRYPHLEHCEQIFNNDLSGFLNAIHSCNFSSAP